MTQKILSVTAGVAILGAILAVLVWHGYLQKQTKNNQTFDSVFSSYAPRGGGGTTQGAVDNTTSRTLPTTKKEIGQVQDALRTLTSGQVAQAPVGNGADVLDGTVRYVDRGKGYVFQTNIVTGKTSRISNIVLPGAFDIRFASPGNALVQTLGKDGTVTAHALTFTKEGNATETPLPYTLLDATTRDGVVYALVASASGGATLISFALPYTAGDKPLSLWSSTLTNWRIVPTKTGELGLEQKPAYTTPGYSYTFNLATKKLEKIAGDKPGLATLVSPSGLYRLETTADEGGLRTVLYNNLTRAEVPLSRATLTEKCVWEYDIRRGVGEDHISETGLVCGFPKQLLRTGLPDLWYRGEFTFDDVLARVDMGDGSITELDTKIKTPVDITSPTLSETGSVFVFTDKTTGSLWTVRNIK